MTDRSPGRGVIEAVLAIDHDQFDRAFTVALLIFVGTLLAVTPQYREESQLFPLVIGVPTFALLCFLLSVQLSPRLRSLVSGYASSDLFDLDAVASDVEQARVEGGRVQRTLAEERTSVVAISVWTAGLFGLVGLVGFLPGTMLFMLLFYRIQADQSWLRTVLYSTVMWAFIVIIFEVVLNTPFYTGVLGVELPLPF